MNYDDLRLLVRQEIERLFTPRMGPQNYPTAKRRRKRPMCESCVKGNHAGCQSYGCPCICNDAAWYGKQPIAV